MLCTNRFLTIYISPEYESSIMTRQPKYWILESGKSLMTSEKQNLCSVNALSCTEHLLCYSPGERSDLKVSQKDMQLLRQIEKKNSSGIFSDLLKAHYRGTFRIRLKWGTRC